MNVRCNHQGFRLHGDGNGYLNLHYGCSMAGCHALCDAPGQHNHKGIANVSVLAPDQFQLAISLRSRFSEFCGDGYYPPERHFDPTFEATGSICQGLFARSVPDHGRAVPHHRLLACGVSARGTCTLHDNTNTNLQMSHVKIEHLFRRDSLFLYFSIKFLNHLN